MIDAINYVAPFAGAWIETKKGKMKAWGQQVAPFAGAWIETRKSVCDIHIDVSPPSRGRGLKPTQVGTFTTAAEVAPFAGAWIETGSTPNSLEGEFVAPFAGAWIETALMEIQN